MGQWTEVHAEGDVVMRSHHAYQKTGKQHQQEGKKEQSPSLSSCKPWYRSATFIHFLLLFSICQLALFVPLARWAQKHPVDSIDLAITHAFQKKHSPFLVRLALVINFIGGSPRLLLVLLIPLALFFWKVHLYGK